MVQLSSSKELDCPGLLTSFKTLSLRPKGSFVQPSPPRKKNSPLEGDRLRHPCLGNQASSQPSGAVCNLVPATSYQRQAFVLSQFGCLPAKNAVGTAMQRPRKELFLGPISILFSTGGEMQGLKVARPRGCWQAESQASRSEQRQGDLILWRGRSNQRLIPLPKVQKTEEGELLTEKGVLLHCLRSHQKK